MLETRIAELTAAVQANTAALQALAGAGGAPAQAAAVVPQAQAPVTMPTPGAVPGLPAAPAMPAPPAFLAQTPAPAPVGGAPFSDVPGLIDYATKSYEALEAKGKDRGLALNQVLAQLGCGNVGALPATHYAAFYNAVEQLKAQP